MKPLPIPLSHIDVFWPHVCGHIQKALDQNTYTVWDLGSVHQQCRTGNFYLFVDDLNEPKNTMVGQFINYAHGRSFGLLFIGGEGGVDWKELFKGAREFAEDHGVTEIVGFPRKGWKRFFKMRTVMEICVIEE